MVTSKKNRSGKGDRNLNLVYIFSCLYFSKIETVTITYKKKQM